MRVVIIALGMVACLFGPSVVFSVVGYKAMEALAKRPTRGASVMIALITKLLLAGMVTMALLMVLFKLLSKKIT